MKNGRRYEDLLTVFPQGQDWYLMGVLNSGKNLNSEEVFQDSDLSLFSVFYVVSRNENVVVSLDDCELFAELVTGDYWSLICAGYLFAEYGLSSFQMSVLLAQSFKKWEPDTDNFVWDEFLEKVQLNY